MTNIIKEIKRTEKINQALSIYFNRKIGGQMHVFSFHNLLRGLRIPEIHKTWEINFENVEGAECLSYFEEIPDVIRFTSGIYFKDLGGHGSQLVSVLMLHQYYYCIARMHML